MNKTLRQALLLIGVGLVIVSTGCLVYQAISIFSDWHKEYYYKSRGL